MRRNYSGSNNPNYKRGYRFDKDGYILIRKNGKEVREHREIYKHYLLILFDEEIDIPSNVDIHHNDGNVQNNSLINLTALTKSQHVILENTKDMSNRTCLLCDGKTKKDKKGHEQWCKFEYGFICTKCYKRLRR